MTCLEGRCSTIELYRQMSGGHGLTAGAVFPCCQRLVRRFEGNPHAAMRPRCWWRMEESNPRAAHILCAADGVTAPPRFPAPVLHISAGVWPGGPSFRVSLKEEAFTLPRRRAATVPVLHVPFVASASARLAYPDTGRLGSMRHGSTLQSSYYLGWRA